MNWNFFDAIYCINLEKDKEKRRKCQSIFNRYSIPAIFFKGILDEIGDRGCLKSHKAIYNLALDKGYNKILIFEDDIVPTSEISLKNINYYTDFIEKQGVDIFYLGGVPDCFNYSQKRTAFPNIYKIRGICTHAYALNRKGLEKLKDIKYTPELPLDYIIKKSDTIESFAAYPSLFYQETGYKIPRSIILSGLKFNEWYAYYIGVPVKYIIVIIVIVLVFYLLKNSSLFHLAVQHSP